MPKKHYGGCSNKYNLKPKKSEKEAKKYKEKNSNRSCENKNTDTAQRLVDLFVTASYAALVEEFPPNATLVVQDQSGTIPFAGTYTGPAGVAQLLYNLASVSYPIPPVPDTSARGETYFTCDYRKVLVVVHFSALYNCLGSSPPGTFPDAAPAYFINTFDDHCNLLQVEIFFNEAILIEFFSTCS
jgi:hypothetical protein